MEFQIDVDRTRESSINHVFESLIFVTFFHYKWNQILCIEISLVLAHLDEGGAEEGLQNTNYEQIN